MAVLRKVVLQAPAVQRLDNAIHRINHYQLDSVVCFVYTYPVDSVTQPLYSVKPYATLPNGIMGNKCCIKVEENVTRITSALIPNKTAYAYGKNDLILFN